MATIYGNDLKNSLAGTSYADLIMAYGDNDTIGGGAGTDSIWAGTGNDWADGGTWDDRVYGEAGNDTLYGSGGHDYLNGGADNDYLNGGDGNDTMDGGVGVDTMVGGIGNDVYVVDDAADVVVEAAGEGIDEIRFGDLYVQYPYADTYGTELDYRYPYHYAYADLAGTNIENMTYTGSTVFFGLGTDVANVIKSSAASTGIRANGGNDRVETTGAYAAIEAGEGQDTVIGGNGREEVSGGAGNDLLLLGKGDDYGMGDGGKDSIEGGEGNDTLAGGAGSDTLAGGLGDDLLTTRGSLTVKFEKWVWNGLYYVTPTKTLDGNTSPGMNDGYIDYLNGGEGNDTMIGFAADVLKGGVGDDTYDVVASSHATIVENLDEGVDTVIVHGTNSYTLGSMLENLSVVNDSVVGGVSGWGNSSDNLMVATNYADVLHGLDGNDRLLGRAGNDLLLGEGGNDSIDSGDGDDTAAGDVGDDTVEGGMGNDWAEGNDGNDVVLGGYGADTVYGGDGDDVVAGDFTFDPLWPAQEGADIVNGGFGNDTVHGGGGNDTIAGSDGNDLMIGGKGADQIWGGGGADIFRFSAGDCGTATLKRDLVMDFARGEDKIDLSQIDTDPLTAGIQGVHLSNGVEAYGVWQGVDNPKTVSLIAEPSATRIMIDTNGDAMADMVIGIQFGDGMKATKIDVGDFIF